MPEQAPTTEPLTVDLAPTWAGTLPIMLAAVQDGTPEGKRIAHAELKRLCRIADELLPAMARALDAMQDAVQLDQRHQAGLPERYRAPVVAAGQALDLYEAIRKNA